MNTHWVSTGLCFEVLCLHLESEENKEYSKMYNYRNETKKVQNLAHSAPLSQTSLKNVIKPIKEIIIKLVS